MFICGGMLAHLSMWLGAHSLHLYFIYLYLTVLLLYLMCDRMCYKTAGCQYRVARLASFSKPELSANYHDKQ